jgi:DNA polymerase-3 subunit gamma/tau
VAEPAAALPAAAGESAVEAATDIPGLMAAADWRGLIRALGLSGLVRELAQHCTWMAHDYGQLRLRLSPTHRHLLDMNRAAVERIQDQLGAALGQPLRMTIEIGEPVGETPAQRDEVERRARHAEAVAQLEADPFVRDLMQRFDATLIEASVRPL